MMAKTSISSATTSSARWHYQVWDPNSVFLRGSFLKRAGAHLIENKVEFYTNEKRSERQIRVVVRGLPPEYVKMNLKEKFQKISKLRKIKKK